MKWEYKRVLLDFWLGGDRDGEEEPLNELGKEEWEIFHIQQVGNDERNQVVFCKRPILPKKKLIPLEKTVEKLLQQLTKK